MQIKVKVIPQSKRNQILKETDEWRVYLTAPAVDGKANKALIALLADHLGVRKSEITLIKGLKSRHKTINIDGISSTFDHKL